MYPRRVNFGLLRGLLVVPPTILWIVSNGFVSNLSSQNTDLQRDTLMVQRGSCKWWNNIREQYKTTWNFALHLNMFLGTRLTIFIVQMFIWVPFEFAKFGNFISLISVVFYTSLPIFVLVVSADACNEVSLHFKNF